MCTSDRSLASIIVATAPRHQSNLVMQGSIYILFSVDRHGPQPAKRPVSRLQSVQDLLSICQIASNPLTHKVYSLNSTVLCWGASQNDATATAALMELVTPAPGTTPGSHHLFVGLPSTCASCSTPKNNCHRLSASVARDERHACPPNARQCRCPLSAAPIQAVIQRLGRRSCSGVLSSWTICSLACSAVMPVTPASCQPHISVCSAASSTGTCTAASVHSRSLACALHLRKR